MFQSIAFRFLIDSAHHLLGGVVGAGGQYLRVVSHWIIVIIANGVNNQQLHDLNPNFSKSRDFASEEKIFNFMMILNKMTFRVGF
jgi:hypothetical protein